MDAHSVTVFLVARGSTPAKAMLRDVSTEGLGLVLRQGFDPGAALFVRLRSPTPAGVRTHLVRVVHNTRLWPGSHYLVGCRLACPLTPEELALLAADGP